MEFDDLKIIWSEQEQAPLFALDRTALHRRVEKKWRELQRRLLTRDLVELGAGLLVVVVWTVSGVWKGNQPGNALLDFWYFFVAAGLVSVAVGFLWVGRVRQEWKERQFDDSLGGMLDRGIAQLDYQVSLLRGVLWWYLLPILVAIYLIVFNESDRFGPDWFRTAYPWLVAFLFVFIYWLNQRAVKKDLLPKKKDLESLRAKLEE